MRFNRRSDSPLKKRTRRGFRGYPIATIAFYGSNDKHASKVVVGIRTILSHVSDSLGYLVRAIDGGSAGGGASRESVVAVLEADERGLERAA
jgi:hypothetical protein